MVYWVKEAEEALKILLYCFTYVLKDYPAFTPLTTTASVPDEPKPQNPEQTRSFSTLPSNVE